MHRKLTIPRENCAGKRKKNCSNVRKREENILGESSEILADQCKIFRKKFL